MLEPGQAQVPERALGQVLELVPARALEPELAPEQVSEPGQALAPERARQPGCRRR